MAAMTASHRNVELVLSALRAAGAAPRALEGMRVLPDAVSTAAAAAEALGVEVGQIANSLVFDADGVPLLVLTSGAHRVDTGKVAGLVGAQRVRRASPEFVRAATGQVIVEWRRSDTRRRCARWSTGTSSGTPRCGPPAVSRTPYFPVRALNW
jgi:Aminoacyl-tRNA editing domain